MKALCPIDLGEVISINILVRGWSEIYFTFKIAISCLFDFLFNILVADAFLFSVIAHYVLKNSIIYSVSAQHSEFFINNLNILSIHRLWNLKVISFPDGVVILLSDKTKKRELKYGSLFKADKETKSKFSHFSTFVSIICLKLYAS